MDNKYNADYLEAKDILFGEMDHFSRLYGDQELIESLEEWLASRMGREFIIDYKDSEVK